MEQKVFPSIAQAILYSWGIVALFYLIIMGILTISLGEYETLLIYIKYGNTWYKQLIEWGLLILICGYKAKIKIKPRDFTIPYHKTRLMLFITGLGLLIGGLQCGLITLLENGRVAPVTLMSLFQGLLLAPILEEIFFRRILLEQLCKRYSPMVGLVTSSLLFAPHGPVLFDVLWLIPYLGLAFYLGWVYLKTRSVCTCILAHSVFNLVVLSFRAFIA